MASHEPTAHGDDPPNTPPEGPSDRLIEELLIRASHGEQLASTDLLPLVYDHLRMIARAKLESEPASHTLQPTALVHEAYVRLVRADRPWKDKRHFFAAAALAMRRILIDHARAKRGDKRGGVRQRVPLELAEEASAAGNTPVDGRFEQEGDSLDWIALERAMSALESHDPGLAEVVHLRYFAGLTVEETALAIGVSTRTVNRDWLVGRAWLLRSMRLEER